MEARGPARDVVALFRKAGLPDSGTYRDFSYSRVPVADHGESAEMITNDVTRDLSEILSCESARFDAYRERRAQPLKSVFMEVPPEATAETPAVGTSIAVFSLAGGVGKTMLASTLARILSGRNHRVMLANFASSFAMRHLYGTNSQTVGPFTLLHPSQGEVHLPMTLVEAGETLGEQDQDHTLKLIKTATRGADVSLFDFQSGRSKFNLERLRMASQILVPILPDVQSALTLQAIEGFLRGRHGAELDIHYILNRYQESRPAHREMRDRFQGMLGDALVPFVIRDEPEIQDAMRSGLTIVDYAPHLEIVEDLRSVGEWVETKMVHLTLAKGMTA